MVANLGKRDRIIGTSVGQGDLTLNVFAEGVGKNVGVGC